MTSIPKDLLEWQISLARLQANQIDQYVPGFTVETIPFVEELLPYAETFAEISIEKAQEVLNVSLNLVKICFLIMMAIQLEEEDHL